MNSQLHDVRITGDGGRWLIEPAYKQGFDIHGFNDLPLVAVVSVAAITNVVNV